MALDAYGTIPVEQEFKFFFSMTPEHVAFIH